MITIDLEKEKVDLAGVISLAKEEPVLLLASDGTEFFLSEADDFDKEVEALRASSAFQRFLDERSASSRRIDSFRGNRKRNREGIAGRKSNCLIRPPLFALKPPRVGRNDPCPCGSGKKYNKCDGAAA